MPLCGTISACRSCNRCVSGRTVAEWIDDQSTFRVAYESTTLEGIMRFVQAIILLIFLGMLGDTAPVQNTEDITVTFWSM